MTASIAAWSSSGTDFTNLDRDDVALLIDLGLDQDDALDPRLAGGFGIDRVDLGDELGLDLVFRPGRRFGALFLGAVELEGDRRGEDGFLGRAVDDQGFINPLLDGVDRRLVERRNRPQDHDVLHPPLDIRPRREDDHPLDAGLSGLFRIDGVDLLDQLGRLDLVLDFDGSFGEFLDVFFAGGPVLDTAFRAGLRSAGDTAGGPAAHLFTEGNKIRFPETVLEPENRGVFAGGRERRIEQAPGLLIRDFVDFYLVRLGVRVFRNDRHFIELAVEPVHVPGRRRLSLSPRHGRLGHQPDILQVEGPLDLFLLDFERGPGGDARRRRGFQHEGRGDALGGSAALFDTLEDPELDDASRAGDRLARVDKDEPDGSQQDDKDSFSCSSSYCGIPAQTMTMSEPWG